MNINKALSVWTKEGKPVIHLGSGRNCFDLEKTLKLRRTNKRHLDAIRKWLEERRQ